MAIKKTNKKRFIGNRVIKTGIAVFLTSAICIYFDLPVIFAVITAIVSIEPTTSDSIRKGIIRFPASAIGAGLATTSYYFLGETALTYTIAAFLTIILCQKFKLQEGTLVAALTAVAMIPELHDHVFISFLLRLGTTTIGLTVSSLVNAFILPVNYLSEIRSRNNQHVLELKKAVQAEIRNLLFAKKERKSINETSSYDVLRNKVSRTEYLIRSQRREMRFHRFKMGNYRRFHLYKQTTNFIQRAVLHLGNLHYLSSTLPLTNYEKELLVRADRIVGTTLKDTEAPLNDEYFKFIDELDNHLRSNFTRAHPVNVYSHDHHHLTEKSSLFYELVAFFDLVEDLHYHLNKRVTKRYWGNEQSRST
ncbi:FUSC family protein [Salipaludibacillus sp. CF4.18]|uniref:FUSC family protein n=1 Tax=Salipaludibacillus sp. CF4.18 TaxID=3373081 RepID=UPI003EE5D848